MGYRVITMDEEGFADACRRLESLCEDFAPDLIVGIATGGEYVAERMFAGIPHVSIRNQRPGTAKKGRLKGWLQKLPRPIANLLRICESMVLQLKHHEIKDLKLSDETRRALASAHRVLVVDDAIDSGATMAGVLRSLSAAPGEREVRTAAITVTTKRPMVEPDYRLYGAHTLVRFPWSGDFQPR